MVFKFNYVMTEARNVHSSLSLGIFSLGLEGCLLPLAPFILRGPWGTSQQACGPYCHSAILASV